MSAAGVIIYLLLGVVSFVCSLYSDSLYFDIALFGFLILSGIEKICLKLEGK